MDPLSFAEAFVIGVIVGAIAMGLLVRLAKPTLPW